MKQSMVVCGVFALVFSGCVEGKPDLPLETLWWETSEDGFVTYRTNDPQDYDYFGVELYDNANADQDTYQIQCKKMSGHGPTGYGMVFAASDSSHYRLLITLKGSYNLWKQVSGTATQIRDWTDSEFLYPGYGKTNTITVTKDTNRYTVYFNGLFAFRFDDSSALTGTKIGFCAVVGSETEESFPNSPVDLRFKQIP